MTKRELNQLVRTIYMGVQDSGITSHKYYDETYAKVRELRDIAEGAALGFVDDVRIIFEEVRDCELCKRYYVSIEDESTGEKYGGGEIIAAFCGTLQNPRSAYDVCATWWTE